MAEQRELKRTPGLDGVGWPDDEYSADLGHAPDRRMDASTRRLGRHEAPEARSRLGKAADEITVLEPGTPLHQGSTYLDLEHLADGPFGARAGQVVEDGQLIAAKNDLDYETWNALVGQRSDASPEQP